MRVEIRPANVKPADLPRESLENMGRVVFFAVKELLDTPGGRELLDKETARRKAERMEGGEKSA